MYGTTRPVVKRAILDGLNERSGLADVAKHYQQPENAEDVKNDAGELDAVWIDEPDTAGIQVIPNMRTPPHDFDEEYDVVVVVQSIRPLSDGTQEDTDLRAAEILYEVVGLFASNPDLVEKSDNFPYCEMTPAGVLPVVAPVQAGHGTRYELTVHVKARISAS